MPKFLFAYHGGNEPTTQEETDKMMSEWMSWFENMGPNIVDGGNPVMQSHTVAQSGVSADGGANPVTGYTVISAEDHAAACEIAKGCPMVKDGSGTVEVAAVHEL